MSFYFLAHMFDPGFNLSNIPATYCVYSLLVVVVGSFLGSSGSYMLQGTNYMGGGRGSLQL